MITSRIKLDFVRSGAPQTIFAKQGDGGGREIMASLYENGIEYKPETSATVELAFKKQTGKKIKVQGSMYIGNVITATLTDDMLDEPGIGECVFTVHEASPITTQSFYVCVEGSPNYEATPSGDVLLQSKYVDPSLTSQMVFADAGFDGLSSVEVGAIRQTGQATPTVAIDQSTGKITAKVYQHAGYVVSGTRTETLQLPTVAGKTVTAGTTNKKIVEAGSYATGDIYVSAADGSGNSIIVGKWTFHNVITQYPPETGFDVNFKCADNTECNRIVTDVRNGTWQMVFWDASDGAMFDAVVDGQFRNVAYQTIDFGTEPQIIPTAFATWLAANADYEGSGGEDLSAELAAQKALISDIKTALENKSASNCFVVGKWSFDHVTEAPPSLDFNANFICDGTSYERIIITNGGGTWQMVYVEADSGDHWEAVIDGEFDDGTFMTIDFGAEPQTVPAAFAEWLRHSATYIDIETCEISFDGSQGVFTGGMFYTAVNGRVVTTKYEDGFSTPATFTAVRNSYLHIDGQVPNCSGDFSNMGEGNFRIGHAVTFRC